mmetsp:Transcript_24783/g.58803  ORF Transcript_24783/g.58803 Transcript_24783/m.58803 type:complete len:92 (+) Transcript_24783:168-443(+)
MDVRMVDTGQQSKPTPVIEDVHLRNLIQHDLRQPIESFSYEIKFQTAAGWSSISFRGMHFLLEPQKVILSARNRNESLSHNCSLSLTSSSW